MWVITSILPALPGVIVCTPPQDRCGILAFTVEGITPQALETAGRAGQRHPRRLAVSRCKIHRRQVWIPHLCSRVEKRSQ